MVKTVRCWTGMSFKGEYVLYMYASIASQRACTIETRLTPSLEFTLIYIVLHLTTLILTNNIWSI